jgi:hypothetical protein
MLTRSHGGPKQPPMRTTPAQHRQHGGQQVFGCDGFYVSVGVGVHPALAAFWKWLMRVKPPASSNRPLALQAARRLAVRILTWRHELRVKVRARMHAARATLAALLLLRCTRNRPTRRTVTLGLGRQGSRAICTLSDRTDRWLPKSHKPAKLAAFSRQRSPSRM